MTETLLVIHIFIALAMIVLVLLQRSEGGALGIGGGQGGGMFSGRGVADTLTRVTTFLAIAFFLTSIGLTILSGMEASDSVLDGFIEPQETDVFQAPAPQLPEGFGSDNSLPDLPTQ
ncbi:MAG: preprotein translocase subunit SecG [Parvibaculales bacterium]